MKQLISFCLLIAATSFTVNAQEYTETASIINKEFTMVYKYVTNSSNKDEQLYGLINKAKKLVVPIKYKYISYAGERNLVKVTLPNLMVGLADAESGKIILENEYETISNFSEGLAVVRQKTPPYNYVSGAIDISGKMIIPMEHDYLGSCNEGLLNFRKDGKLGFINKKNEVVIEPQYSGFSHFSNGLAAVKLPDQGKYGYIDKNNKVIIPAKYENAFAFSDGYAVVVLKEKEYSGKGASKTVMRPAEYKLINQNGKELHETPFHLITPTNYNGLFIVTLNDKQGVVDTTGKIIIPTMYKDISIDERGIKLKTDVGKYGLADVKGKLILQPEYDYISYVINDLMYAKKDKQYTVFNNSLQKIIPADEADGIIVGKKKIVLYSKDRLKLFDQKGKLLKTLEDIRLKSSGHRFSEAEDSIKLNGDALVKLVNLSSNKSISIDCNEAGDFNEDGIFITKNPTYAFYDHTGKKLNKDNYYAAINFSEGICALQIAETSKPFLADKNFNFIQDLTVTFTGPFSEGLGSGYLQSNYITTFKYLDKKGNIVFSINAKAAGICTNGFIMIENNVGKYEFLNKSGKQIVTKFWDAASDFNEGLALVKTNGKYGYIDTTGNLAISAIFEQGASFENGVAIVKANGQYYQINKKGEPLNADKYDGASTPKNGTFPVQKNKKTGLIDAKGKTVINFEYDNIKTLNDDRVWALKENKWGLLDSKGKAVTGFIYENAGDFENGFAKVVQDGKMGLINKSGKLVVPIEYGSIGSVYKNAVVVMSPAKILEIAIDK